MSPNKVRDGDDEIDEKPESFAADICQTDRVDTARDDPSTKTLQTDAELIAVNPLKKQKSRRVEGVSMGMILKR